MTLEQLVVSLELAKQLKEAGYPQQQSCFRWHNFNNNQDDNHWQLVDFYPNMTTWYAAPTASELLEKMPLTIKDSENDNATLAMGNWYKGYWCEYHCTFNPPAVRFMEKATLVEALGEMWLYLKQNGLLSPIKENV